MGDARSVVAELNETINAHDVPGGRRLYAPHAHLVTAQGRRLDLDGIDAMVTLTLRAFPDLKMTVLRWVEDSDTVVTEEVMEGTHQGEFAGIAPTGQRVRLPMAHFTRVVDGRIVERIAYHDTAGILRQLSGD